MKQILLFCLATILSAPASAEYLGARSDIFGYRSIEELLTALKRRPSATVSKRDGWTIVAVEEGRELWTITPKTHPAHPSVARRRLIQTGGDWSVQTRIRCSAAKPKCDQLARDYQKLDDDMKKNIEKAKGKR